MICPIMSYQRPTNVGTACAKEECAWYNKNKEECCIKVLSDKMEDVIDGDRIIFTREV